MPCFKVAHARGGCRAVSCARWVQACQSSHAHTRAQPYGGTRVRGRAEVLRLSVLGIEVSVDRGGELVLENVLEGSTRSALDRMWYYCSTLDGSTVYMAVPVRIVGHIYNKRYISYTLVACVQLQVREVISVGTVT